MIGFLSNFIYGLLLSNRGSCVNMSFVQQTITKIANKMPAAYQFASILCCGHSNLVILNRISSKFHIWFASIKPWLKFEYEFCWTNYNQDCRQTGRRLSVCVPLLLWSPLLRHFSSDFFQFSYIYLLLLSHSGSSLNMSFVRPTIVKIANKWPPPASSHSWTPYLSHLLPDCFQISYMDYFYQTLT